MKVFLQSLGCDKNLVDAEHMTALLSKAGIGLTDDPAEAEVLLVNTCCFIGDAKEESIQAILDLAQEKREDQALVVCGCLAERYREEIPSELPEVDAMFGTASWTQVVSVVKEAAAGKRREEFLPLSTPERSAPRRLTVPGSHYGYLKIAEGCDRHCTYCVIPSVRGPYRSVPAEELVAEARSLVSQGAREVILVAQETTIYGKDVPGSKGLPDLLRRLSEIEDLSWIRLLYCYPEAVTEELLSEIRDNPKVCDYLDVPVQHIADPILKAMGRGVTGREIEEKIRLIRETVPGIALRTTLMTGFPGETEEDHQALLSFVKRTDFDRLGVFCYSREEGTAADTMEPQVPEEVKERRREELMEAASAGSLRRNEKLIGQVLPVLVEGFLPDEGAYAARSYRDAPEVDGLVFFESERELLTGEMRRVRIREAGPYDLWGSYYEPAE